MTLDETITRLVRLRDKRGLTQRDLADRIGVTQSTLALWETRRQQPSARNLVDWIAALDAELAVHVAGEYCERERVWSDCAAQVIAAVREANEHAAGRTGNPA